MNLSAPLDDKSNALEVLSSCEEVYNGCTIKTDACHVLLQETDDWIMATFRGSQSAEDWIHDAEFEFMSIRGGRVHTGIWTSYLTIKPKLLPLLSPVKPLIIPGHSLGGGQGGCCAWDLHLDYNIAFVPSFGSPRWADSELAANYNAVLKDRTIRWVDARDIVARLPFRDMGFSHVGHEAFLKSSGGKDYDPSEWEMLTDDVRGGMKDVLHGDIEILNDHHLPRYRGRIMALA